MKKLKNLWANNRILLILGVILIACIIAIIIVFLTYFVGTKKSVYGSRFDNMKTHIKEAEQNSYIQAVEERSGVEKATLRVKGKTMYIRVVFKDDIKLDDAKKIIDSSLEKFSDDVKETYDMNFTIKNSSFVLMGARNASGNGLSWNNNTPVEKTKE
ncbi:MAG: hypothetical protein IKX00_01340 [Bacilli bacterium]|nr:hypothetical protein [Bacilli bacterium]